MLLKFDDRCKQQGFVFGGKGTCIEFDFPAPPRLRTDDLLVLDDGKLAEVVADIEPVIEVRAREFTAVARLILALGNRHMPVQVLANRIRLQKRPEIEALLAEHGLAGIEMAAPFEPDDGRASIGTIISMAMVMTIIMGMRTLLTMMVMATTITMTWGEHHLSLSPTGTPASARKDAATRAAP